jgi:hypothetical protein
MLFLLLLACWLAPHLRSAKAAFDLMLLIGAGSGSVFLLRWFWMRINAWTELTGMGVSLVVALVLQFGFPEMLPWQRMLITIAITSASWLIVTLLTRPTDPAVATRFKAAVRASGRDVGRGLLLTAIAAFTVYDLMYAVGAWIYGWTAKACVATALALVASGGVYALMRGGRAAPAQPANSVLKSQLK